MAITFVTAVDGGNNAGSTNSMSFSVDVGSGTDRGLVVGVQGGTGTEGDDVTGITFNSVAMTLAGKKLHPGSSTDGRWVYLYVLHNPSSGSHNVVVSATSTHYLLAVASVYTGVLQSSTVDASGTNSATLNVQNLTSSVTSVTDNCWMIALRGTYAGGAAHVPTAGTGATRREYDHALGTIGIFDSNGPITPAGSYSMTTTYDIAPQDTSAQVQIAWAPAAGGGGGGTVPKLMLMGCG